MAKRKTAGIILEQLKDYIRELPISKAVGLDKRSVKKTKRILGELGEYRPSVIAEQLGISTQKYTALRRKAERGEAASPILSEVLQGINSTLREGRVVERLGEYRTEDGEKYNITYRTASKTFVKQHLNFSQNIKPGGFASLPSALNWLGGVTGGVEYFWLVKDKDRYFVYDVRTASEKSNKGGVSGNTKAEKVFEKYGINETMKGRKNAKRTTRANAKRR